MAYWLLKSEPAEFGIADLAHAPHRRAAWDGVRNYQARNFLRAMKAGDEAFFYHSSCARPGVVGRVAVVREGYADPTQFEVSNPRRDPRATPEKPRWTAVDVELRERFERPVSLQQMRSELRLAGLQVLRRGNRLSVTPVIEDHWRVILDLAHARR